VIAVLCRGMILDGEKWRRLAELQAKPFRSSDVSHALLGFSLHAHWVFGTEFGQNRHSRTPDEMFLVVLSIFSLYIHFVVIILPSIHELAQNFEASSQTKIFREKER
jgi:hypothetical protein